MWERFFGTKNEKTAQIKILGMHCTACATNIDLTLEELPGIKAADTNYAKGITVVEIGDNFDPKQTVEAIAKLGYKARVI